MKRSRIVLLTASCVVVMLLAGGSLAVRVGAADGAYGDVILFSELLALISDNYVDVVDADGLLEGAYEGMLSSLDPHGAYLTPEEVAEWKRNRPDGAADPGLFIAKLHGSFEVASVAPGSPAEEAGLEAGDQIRSIEDRASRNLSVEQALRLLRGKEGTRVSLEVLHPRRGFEREAVELDRRMRDFPAWAVEVRDGVAILTIHDLSRLDLRRLGGELDGVRSRGIDRLLLDLRNVTEGGPREALSVADLFREGTSLRLRDRSGTLVRTLEGSRGRVAWRGELALLVNRLTVGGAEALAKALQDGSRARVYGETTYGLGSEPELFELADGSGLLFSTGLWETDAGGSWNDTGVEPDLPVRGEGPRDEVAADQLRRAVEAFVEDTDGTAEVREAA